MNTIIFFLQSHINIVTEDPLIKIVQNRNQIAKIDQFTLVQSHT